MAPKKPPPKKPAPKCPPHRWKFPATETNGYVVHTCKKCGATNKRPKGKVLADGIGWGAG